MLTDTVQSSAAWCGGAEWSSGGRCLGAPSHHLFDGLLQHKRGMLILLLFSLFAFSLIKAEVLFSLHSVSKNGPRCRYFVKARWPKARLWKVGDSCMPSGKDEGLWSTDDHCSNSLPDIICKSLIENTFIRILELTEEPISWAGRCCSGSLP